MATDQSECPWPSNPETHSHSPLEGSSLARNASEVGDVVSVEQAAGASQLASWQRDRGYNVSAGMEEVRTWPWLCPRPAAPTDEAATSSRDGDDDLDPGDGDVAMEV